MQFDANVTPILFEESCTDYTIYLYSSHRHRLVVCGNCNGHSNSGGSTNDRRNSNSFASPFFHSHSLASLLRRRSRPKMDPLPNPSRQYVLLFSSFYFSYQIGSCNNIKSISLPNTYFYLINCVQIQLIND